MLSDIDVQICYFYINYMNSWIINNRESKEHTVPADLQT